MSRSFIGISTNSNHPIDERIIRNMNHEKLCLLSKKEIARANGYFKRKNMDIRIEISGIKTWEIWYI